MRVFGGNEYALFFEVGDATGFSQKRWADALVMSCWPSRGLHLTCYEIKVSRSDWLNEKKKPEKAEVIASRCEYMILLTAPDVVLDPIEIPHGWGWTVYDGRQFKKMKEAPLRECEPCDRAFLAAILRRAARNDQAIVDTLVAEAQEKALENLNERLNNGIKNATRHFEEEFQRLNKKIAEFEEASGISLGDRWTSGKDIGRAVAAVRAAGIFEVYGGIANLSTKLRESADRLDKAGAGLGMEMLKKGG